MSSPQLPTPSVSRVVLASFIGTTIEWYDFFLYGTAAALVFNLCSLLPEESFLRWGWRVPFLLGITLLGVGLFIRLRVPESPLFAQLQDRSTAVRVPLIDVVRRYPGNVFLAMGARFAENGCFYIFSVFVLTYAQDILHLPRTTILNGVLQSQRFSGSARLRTQVLRVWATWCSCG